MATNNDTTLHQLAYVLNKNCSANDLQIYTNGSSEESVGLFHFAHACFLLAYLAPNTKYGHVALHCGLVVGFLILRSVHVFTKQFKPSILPIRITSNFYGYDILLTYQILWVCTTF